LTESDNLILRSAKLSRTC